MPGPLRFPSCLESASCKLVTTRELVTQRAAQLGGLITGYKDKLQLVAGLHLTTYVSSVTNRL